MKLIASKTFVMNIQKHIAIIGAGPCGLMAAEQLAKHGYNVTVYDQMPSVARKFLLAGRGGLNLTHSEPLEKFILRYGNASSWLTPSITSFPPEALRKWCEDLGQATFTGSSGRVFPIAMKAAPLLRAWLGRLHILGVKFALRHCWQGWSGDDLVFNDTVKVKADATLLALGGASWARLGSNGKWCGILSKEGVDIAALRPANCGFITEWSEYFTQHFAGHPLKPVALTYNGVRVQGEMMITQQGIEGGAVYALSSALREAVSASGKVVLTVDLRPALSLETLTQKLNIPRGSKSLSTYLHKCGFSSLTIALLRQIIPDLATMSSLHLATCIKSLPLLLTATHPIDRAISTAGGIKQSELTPHFMLYKKPGLFCAGEMLDWEAPTGGYLLQGCFSTAVTASEGILHYLK